LSRFIPINKPTLGEEELEEIRKVIESGILTSWHGSGPVTERFERAFAEYIGVKHVIAVSSGTAALQTALAALGIGPGDEVIVPPFSFIATANVVLLQGAKPKFVDIEPKTFNLDPEKLAEAITDKVKAVIPVHVYGHPADMRPIMEIAEDSGVAVIEDAAEAHGAEYNGRKAGAIGHIAAFSFYATKNMTTGGEGGVIATDSDELARKARLYRAHGQEEAYKMIALGTNCRMTEIASAIGIVQLRKLEGFIEARRRNAYQLTSLLTAVSGLEPPYEAPNVRHVYYLYTVRVKESFPLSRDELSAKLREAGIGTSVSWPTPIHLQPYYKKTFGYRGGEYPVSEQAAKEVLSLPVHPAVTEGDIRFIAKAIKELAEGA